MRLGILVATPPGRTAFRYAFTPSDAVWLGRLLASGSGDRYRGRRQALLWAAFTRFALQARGGLSFADFVQRVAPSLTRVAWSQLPPRARRLALAAVSGMLTSQSPSAVVRVVPRGYAPGASPYSYGQGASGPAGYRQGAYGYRPRTGSSGWGHEMEMEDAPAQTDGAGQTPPAPPPAPTKTADAAPPTDAPPDDSAMPDAGDGAGEPMGDEPPPPAFDTQDGNQLVMNPKLLRSLMGAFRRRHPRWRHPQDPRWRYPNAPMGQYAQRNPYRQGGYGYPRYTPGGVWRSASGFRPSIGAPYTRSFVARSPSARRAIVGRVARLASGARRVGTLRGVRNGRRYPVFGGRVAGKPYRIVTRPRGAMRHEIMAVRGGPLQQELAI